MKDGLSKNLDPLNNPEDLRTLERHAFQNGWRVNLRDGRVINPNREKRPDSPASSHEAEPVSSSPTDLSK